ncbi:hypothetical protein AVEN_198601-1, partial [Araneus ventricosus]
MAESCRNATTLCESGALYHLTPSGEDEIRSNEDWTRSSKVAFLRRVFPRASSALRVIPRRRNRKNRCGWWTCECFCFFPRCG